MSHDALHTRKNISQAIVIWVPPDYFLNALNKVSIFQVLLKSPGVLRKWRTSSEEMRGVEGEQVGSQLCSRFQSIKVSNCFI